MKRLILILLLVLSVSATLAIDNLTSTDLTNNKEINTVTFIPYADPNQASATVAGTPQWQNSSIAPFTNNAAGYAAAAQTPNYQSAVANGSLPSGSGTPTDPYAQYGGKANYDAQVNGYDAQRDNIVGSAHNAAGQSASGLHSSILDFLDSLKQGQGRINNQGVQNELARTQANQGILGMIGRGIRSGGVMLANKNASDSSAAGALANAYGQLGRQQMSNVGNQYALGQNAVDQSQADLEMQRGQGMRHINESKVSSINSIVNDAAQKLGELDAQIAGANLPNRIAIQQQQDQIRQDALNQLQAFDQELASGSQGIQASSQDARRLQASSLANAGQAADNQFNYQGEAPAQFAGTGPFASDIPLFSFNKKNQQQFA